MKNKNGFVSMTLVYTFLIIFLFLMLAILNTYNVKNKYLEAIDSKVEEDIKENRKNKDSILNRLITDNTPDLATNIKFHRIANLYFGNGNGLFYSKDVNLFDEDNDKALLNNIYFFRGEVENNYLILKDMCFRILRTDEKGNLRIMYAGDAVGNTCTARSEGKSIGTAAFNDSLDSPKDSKYLGYMYDDSALHLGSLSSGIKKLLDEWYDEHLKDDDRIVDAIYCNNKVITQPDMAGTRYYHAYNFNIKPIDLENLNPYVDNYELIEKFSVKCTDTLDRYTLSNYVSGSSYDSGNKLLSYPVGTVTVEDIILAGGRFIFDTNAYLTDEEKTRYVVENGAYYMARKMNYWTMTSYSYSDTPAVASAVYVDAQGRMQSASVKSEFAVIPVITIDKDSSVASGTGVYNNPYILK